MSNCKTCPYGPTSDALSDVCDGCQNDPDTGWGGFTDHKLGMHFNSEEEREKHVKQTEDSGEQSDETESFSL